MLQEMYHKSWILYGQLRPEVCGHVHGQVHGLLQLGFQGLHKEVTARTK